MVLVPEVVRNKALATGDEAWLDGLDAMLADLADEWGLTTGASIEGGTEAVVLEATMRSGREAVLKVLVPRDGTNAREEAAVLAECGGRGCAELLRFDGSRSALLIERLGPSMFDGEVPYEERLPILIATAAAVWRPPGELGDLLVDGRTKAEWLVEFIEVEWERLDRPCSRAAVDDAVSSARRRARAHDPDRAVLCHGDVHQWNALRAASGWKLVDPDGVIAEPECDLGIILREDPEELMARDPAALVADVARRTGTDPGAIWDWAFAERVSTGLVATGIELQPVGRHMLAAADALAATA
ncbi:MAG: aminoglycoside phosphotransferase family protein [Actinomycetota bacterium]